MISAQAICYNDLRLPPKEIPAYLLPGESTVKNEVISITALKDMIRSLSEFYDVVRIVDADECRVVDIAEDDRLSYGDRCFSLWSSESRCANCSSYKACHTGKKASKIEYFRQNSYDIESLPVKVETRDGTPVMLTLEMVSIGENPGALRTREDEEEGFSDKLDTLTGLYNWRGITAEVRDILVSDHEVPRLIVTGDIRHFKLINSLFGRERGNEVLIEIAGILKENFSQDAIIGRARADNFVMCVREDDFDEEKITRMALKIDKEIESELYAVNFHIGVYKIEEDGLSVPVMVDRANLALSKIKTSNEQKISYFSRELLEETLREQMVLGKFRKDLDEGKFKIYLQAQIASDGSFTGCEALSRWVMDDGTVMMPGRFIEILEKSDLIAELDKDVWRQAAKTLASWKGTEFEDKYISVNISPRDFYYMDVPAVIEGYLREYDVTNEKLHLEITETAFADTPETIMKISAQLQKMGFVLEIDDFGKGNSSLSLLKDINASVMKLDMGFIRETINVGRSRAILRAVINLAKDLGMLIISEGVETCDQKDVLKEMGCDVFQGYYYSKPAPIEEFMRQFLGWDRKD